MGQLVFVKSRVISSAVNREYMKFFLLYKDPFKIREVKLENMYELEDPGTGMKVSTQNVVNLKLYIQKEWDEWEGK